jgi:hypothetical protein
MAARVACVLIAGAALAALPAGCGREDPEPVGPAHSDPGPVSPTYSDPDRGFAISYPNSWRRATERMSRLGDPRELVSLGTGELRWRPTNCESFAGSAGYGMRSDDVAITLWERGHDPHSAWRDFPPRPERFGPVPHAEPAGPGCGEPPGTIIHWRNVADAGRHLHTLVRIGPDAPSSVAAQAWAVLDSLRLDSGYRPDWPSSG